jgi:transposase-like protein
LYHVLSLSQRNVETLLAERVVAVSQETVRRWRRKSDQSFANCLGRRRPRLGDNWHLGEVFIRIQGVQHYLWRSFDQDGVVLDIGISPGLSNDVEHRQSWYLNNRASLPGLAVPPAFAPSRDS